MEQEKFVIGQKEYTQDELYLIGKEHFPRFYYIPRILGLICLPAFLIIEVILGIITIIFSKTMDEDFPLWAFYIPLIIFGVFILISLLLVVISFFGRSRNRCIRYGYNYVLKQTNNGGNDRVVSTVNQRKNQEELDRYARLLKGGVITQEEFDSKKEELGL